MSKCYIDGEECTCTNFECPRDVNTYDDLGNESLNAAFEEPSIREEYQEEYDSVQQELLFDNHVWGT